MSRKNVRWFLLIMAIFYQICFLISKKPADLVIITIYLVGTLTMQED